MSKSSLSHSRVRFVAAIGAALVFLVALVNVSSADALPKAPKRFYGVVPQTELGPADFARMEQGRVGTLRVQFPWAFIDTAPGPLDNAWGAIDQIVRQAAQANIRLLPVLYATPSWVSAMDGCANGQTTCFNQAPRSPESLAAWRAFLRQIVGRYGSNGTFWLLNPTVPRKPIRNWQIWNEQNSPSFWAPTPNASEYATLVTEASEAIKGADPDARVILGGMFYSPLRGTGGAIFADKFLRRLYRQPGFANVFDGIALHPYAQAIRSVKAQVDLARKEIRRAGDHDVGIWITEIGWGSNADDDPLTVGKRGQAKKLKQAFRYFTRYRRKYNLMTVNWFSWRNTAPGEAICSWCPRSGLFTRGAMRPKPAWREFTRFTGGT